MLSLPPPPNTTIIPALEQVIRTLDEQLSQTSEELTIASNGNYFCGGHMASDQLSAVRIGEL
eukprot:10503613-Ditylum_brightwellii.AAC.1